MPTSLLTQRFWPLFSFPFLMRPRLRRPIPIKMISPTIPWFPFRVFEESESGMLCGVVMAGMKIVFGSCQ